MRERPCNVKSKGAVCKQGINPLRIELTSRQTPFNAPRSSRQKGAEQGWSGRGASLKYTGKQASSFRAHRKMPCPARLLVSLSVEPSSSGSEGSCLRFFKTTSAPGRILILIVPPSFSGESGCWGEARWGKEHRRRERKLTLQAVPEGPNHEGCRIHRSRTRQKER